MFPAAARADNPLVRSGLLFLCVALVGCGVGSLEEEHESAPAEDYSSISQGLVDCGTRQDTGYRSGTAFPITVISADGKPVERNTGNAYAVMQAAAARQGVGIVVVSGFRTMAEQQYLYACYVNCNCNSCNLAASPGYSNHQSGSALDLNTSNSAVFNWLTANAGSFGFRRTVPSEPWHWEYFGGGPGGGPCTESCDRSAGPLTFSCDGAQAGQACVNVNEPSDPSSWGDNFVCTAADWGLRWSHAGPLPGMDCVATPESSEPSPEIWADNHFCAPPQSPWRFSWSSAGPIAGRSCVQWNEPADPHTWGDNFLCAEPVTSFSNAGFTFSMAGSKGEHCVNVDEPSDPDTWADNYFCSPVELGLRWSYAGPIAGLQCTNVTEGAEAHAAAWADNFLCIEPTPFITLHWSPAGPIAGLPCVRWFEHSEAASNTWGDNWLCIERRIYEAVEPAVPLDARPELLPPAPTEDSPPSEGAQAAPQDAEHLQLQSTGCSSAALLMPGLACWLVVRRRRPAGVTAR